MSSSQLVTILEEWSDSRPEITIQGQQLFVSTEEVTDSPTNCDSSDQYIIAVIVLAVSLLLALIGWLGSCLFFMKFRHNTKYVVVWECIIHTVILEKFSWSPKGYLMYNYCVCINLRNMKFVLTCPDHYIET